MHYSKRLNSKFGPPRFFYKKKCTCKENKERKEKEDRENKKPNIKRRVEGKPAQYLVSDLDETNLINAKTKTFEILYDKPLSLETKLILNSFQKKYLYYAIDDILYTFHLNSNERESLLSLLYSPIISLQNSISVDFFDIWIHELYIEKVSKSNRFLINNFNSTYRIKIKMLYKIKTPKKTRKLLW